MTEDKESPIPTERKVHYVDWDTICAEYDITTAELVSQSLTQKPCYEITGEITDPVEKEELMNLLSNSSTFNES